jgi:hypothetical protein
MSYSPRIQARFRALVPFRGSELSSRLCDDQINNSGEK